MTSIEDEVQAEMSGDARRSCKVCDWIKFQPDPTEWRKVFDNPAFSHSAIYRVTHKHGATFGLATVARHRKDHQ